MPVMEYLVIAVILYFILWTAGNLVRLLSGAEETSAPKGQDRPGSSPPRGWEGPSPRQHTGTARGEPTFWEDIEEATWYDVDDGARRNRNAAN